MASGTYAFVVHRAGSASVRFEKGVAHFVQKGAETVAQAHAGVVRVVIVSVQDRVEQDLGAEDGVEVADAETVFFRLWQPRKARG